MARTDQPDTTGILEEFQRDLFQWWNVLPNKGFFFILLAAWMTVFAFWGNSTLGYIHSPSLFTWMRVSYTGFGPTDQEIGDDRHGFIVPIVVLVLFWWKRKELMPVMTRMWSPGFVIVVAAVMLHVLGYVVQQPRLSIVALFTGIYGLMGLAWGPEFLRASFFPFFLFAFCVPMGSLAEGITFRLRLLVSESVEFVAKDVLAIDVIRQGTALMDPGHYQYDVAAPCAGMRSLIATVGMATVYSFMTFPNWWKRGVLIAAAFPLAVIGNITRMLMIILAAAFWGQSAGNYVHDGGPFGIISLLPYIIPFGGLLWFGYLLGDRAPARAEKAEPQAKEATQS